MAWLQADRMPSSTMPALRTRGLCPTLLATVPFYLIYSGPNAAGARLVFYFYFDPVGPESYLFLRRFFILSSLQLIPRRKNGLFDVQNRKNFLCSLSIHLGMPRRCGSMPGSVTERLKEQRRRPRPGWAACQHLRRSLASCFIFTRLFFYSRRRDE